MSTLTSAFDKLFSSILTPIALLVLLLAGIGWQAELFARVPAGAHLFSPQISIVQPRTFSYRADGEYTKRNTIIDPPMVEVTVRRPLTIMKYQVTVGEYGACVLDGACRPAASRYGVLPDDVPVTGISYDDAMVFARWISAKTGEIWTLPTDQQLAFAAGPDFPDDALGIDPDNKNPALRWLADYKREAAEKKLADPAPRVRGSFGVNEFGVADFGGNVWEWTTTCDRNVHLDRDGSVESEEEVCGVYATVGRHRSPMTSFIRDPRGGGCSVGTPPSNLGFRLVREDRWYVVLARKLRMLV